ncbi:MAG: winged helix-turn-helix domain-containing protein [Bryobacteraceae bacterium]
MDRRIVQFGAFQANLGSGELYRDGIRLKLGGQPFQILATLLIRPGELVTREQLRSAIWEPETFVDFDQSLNTAINKLRETLCDTPSNPRFIETVPRRGYRFIAPVVEPEAVTLSSRRRSANGAGLVAPAAERAAARAEAPLAVSDIAQTVRLKPLGAAAGTPGRRMPWAKMGAALGLTAAAAFAWLFFQRPPALLPAPVPFTSLPGSEYGASFSPDGKQVAFYWGHPESSKSGIYIKQTDPESEKVTPLVVKEPYFNYGPAWSPDGKNIAFLRRTPEGETWLHLIAPAGGPDRRLIRLSSSLRLLPTRQHVSWGPDGQWLLASTSPSGASLIIRRISLTGDALPVTDPARASFGASVSPDGRAFVFNSRPAAAQTVTSEILLQRLNTAGRPEGAPLLIQRPPGGSLALAWTPNGKDLVSCTEDGWAGTSNIEGVVGRTRLFRMPARPGNLTPISSDECSSVTVSRPDSSGRAMLLYGTSSSGKARMWQARLDTLTDASELSPSSRSDAHPAFSPDGTSVAFVSLRSGQPEIWVAGLDGGEARRITNNARVLHKPVWSPDGSQLAYASANFTPLGSAIVPSAGGPSKQLPAGNRLAVFPMWSRDGKFVYFNSGFQFWRMRTDGGEPVRLMAGDRYFAFGEDPDGESIYCARRGNPQSIFRLSRTGGPAEIIEEGISFTGAAVTNGALYFVKDKDNALYRLPFRGGPSRKLGVLPMPGGRAISILSGLTVSPDETRIVWATTDQQIDLALIRDFK